VFKVPPGQTVPAVGHALRSGYRHIDTAAVYGNEAEVGQAINSSGLDRVDVFLTTKCFNDDQGYDEARRAFQASLQRLETDYVDLYLIHWPAPAQDRYVETWRAFIELQAEGLARSIGVSNFQRSHLERLVAETGVTPAINQIELHPRLQQSALRRLHAALGIATEAWSPLARGQLIDEPAIAAIAARHERSAAQVMIRWHVQLGNIVIPKSVTPARIEENIEVFDFELSSEEMALIGELDGGERVGPDPDTFG
jgi:2,5-diketo-D-gluconate reductase A